MGKKKHRIKSDYGQKPGTGILKELAGKEWIIILIIFFAAFFIRGVYLFQANEYSTLSTSLSDPASTDDAARGLIKDGKISSEFFWHAPFYPLFLSLLYSISGSSIIFAKIVQIIIGSLTVVFVYLLAKGFLKKETALTAAAISALCFPLIFFEGELFAEGLAAFFCVLLIYLIVKIKNDQHPVFCYLAGLAGALAITTRPVFLPFLLASLGFCVWRWIQSKKGVRKISFSSAMIFLGLITLLLPICFINLASTGEFTFLPYSGGINFFIGNNPDYNYTITIRPGYAWDQLIGLPRSQGIEGVYAMDNYFNTRAWNFIFSKPLDFIKGILVKTVEFFSSREIPRTEDIYMFRDGAPFLFAGVWKVIGFGFPFGILFPLALIGVFGFRKQIPITVFLMLVLYPLAVIAVFVSSRYRAPLLPIICIMSACGVTWLAGLIKEKKWRILAASTAVVLASAFLVSLPGPFIEERMDLRAEYRLSEGMYYERIKQFQAAIDDYKQAIGLMPCFPDAQYHLGSLHAELGQYQEAEDALSRVLASPIACFFNHTGIPENALYVGEHRNEFKQVYYEAITDTHKLLGNIMLAQNRLDDAFTHYGKATELSPQSFAVIEVMGDIRSAQKNYQDALSLYKQALPYDSNNPALYSKLADAFHRTGDLDNAIINFRTLAKLEPENPVAFFTLGNIYYEKNDIQKALESYINTSKISPFEPAVYYKLGLCYLKLGDNKSAKSAFLKSNELWPDNPLVLEALNKLGGN